MSNHKRRLDNLATVLKPLQHQSSGPMGRGLFDLDLTPGRSCCTAWDDQAALTLYPNDWMKLDRGSMGIITRCPIIGDRAPFPLMGMGNEDTGPPTPCTTCPWHKIRKADE